MTQFSKELNQSMAPNVLGLIIMPTEQCCCRCDYCYEDFLIGKMKDSTQHSIINFISKRAPNLDVLNIEWFGGEPLMAKDVIYSLSEEFKRFSEIFSIRYIAHMTTNAYLLDRTSFEKLVMLGIRSYQITLDGPETIHDKVRKRVDGKGTFKTIFKNLKDIKNSKAQADIILRVHYRPDTWEAVISLIDDLKHEFLDDPRFSVAFRPVSKLGGINDKNLTIFENQTDKAWVERQLITRLFGEYPMTYLSNDLDVCYAAKANHLIIRANGNIAKCTVALSHPDNDVGHLEEDGSLHIRQSAFKKWLVGFKTGDIEQLSCPAGTVLRANSMKNIHIVAETA